MEIMRLRPKTDRPTVNDCLLMGDGFACLTAQH